MVNFGAFVFGVAASALTAVSELAPQPVAFYAAVFFLVNTTYIFLIRELIDRTPVDDVPPRGAGSVTGLREVGSTAWGAAKRNSADLRERIARARDQWAKVRHARHTAALHESQAMRSANRKALKPQPTCHRFPCNLRDLSATCSV